jgi:hypothetical protein
MVAAVLDLSGGVAGRAERLRSLVYNRAPLRPGSYFEPAAFKSVMSALFRSFDDEVHRAGHAPCRSRSGLVGL